MVDDQASEIIVVDSESEDRCGPSCGILLSHFTQLIFLISAVIFRNLHSIP